MDKSLEQLEEILRSLMQEHEALGALVHQKLAALRRADREAIGRCLEEENHRLQRIGELEKQRIRLVAALTQQLDPQARAPLKLSELAERIPEPGRSRLLGLRVRLRQTMQEVGERARVAQEASQVLLRHMQGLFRGLAAAVSGITVYGAGGAASPAALALSTFDTRV